MEWIAVKDKLPPLNCDVLLWCEEKPYIYEGANYMIIGKLYERLRSMYETEQEYQKDKLRWTCIQNVIYWMHLPDSPSQNKPSQ